MAIPAIAALEAKIKAGSHEDAVDDMWVNMGPLYFPILKGYTMTAQSRLRGTSGQKADVGIRKFINGNVRVVICEDSSYEHMNQAAEWESKREQLAAYCGQTRVQESNFTKTIYGIITVGKNSQFYAYAYGQNKLVCLHDENVAFNFKTQSDEIDRWMSYIYDQVDAGY